VGTGTYLRAIARDVGLKIGLGAHLTALRRTKIGEFSVDGATAIDELAESAPRELADAVAHLPAMNIDEDQKTAVINGKKVPTSGNSFEDDRPVALTCAGSLVAIAEKSDGDLQPRVVVAG
jgi:tRNA pseudouridine55 synthase